MVTMGSQSEQNVKEKLTNLVFLKQKKMRKQNIKQKRDENSFGNTK